MTPAQIKLLHIAAKSRGFNDEQYRVLLRNTGKVESSKDLTNEGFEDVMAVLEEKGFRMHDKPADYWRNKVALRGRFGGERMVHFIVGLAAQTRYASGLPGLCMRFSNGRTDKPDKLHPGEAHALAEMLKSVIERSKAAAAKTGAEPSKTREMQAGLFGDATPAPRTGLPDAPASTRAKAPASTPDLVRVAKGAAPQAPRVETQYMGEEEIPF